MSHSPLAGMTAGSLAKAYIQAYTPSKKTVGKAALVLAALAAIGLVAYNFQAVKQFAQTQYNNAQHLISGGAGDAASKPTSLPPALTPASNVPVYNEVFGLDPQTGMWGMHAVKAG